MSTKRTIILLLVSFGIFSDSAPANEVYQVVKVWPEAPHGWHFYLPQGVAVDKSGNVYIGDWGNYCMKKFDAEGRFITQWGSPGQRDGQFYRICSVTVGGSGIVYVVDRVPDKWQHNRIQKFTPYGQFIGTLERTAPDADTIKVPIDLATDDKGNVLVLAVDHTWGFLRNSGVRIEKYSRDGEFISQWGADGGTGDGELHRPQAIAVDAKGDIYIADGGNDRVQKFDSSGKFLTKWGTYGEGDGLFRNPLSIALDKVGDVYVLDSSSVQKFTPEGKFLARWKTELSGRRIALDSHSNAYVTCENDSRVRKLDNTGNLISEWGISSTLAVGGAPVGDGRFLWPASIAIDPSGHVIITDFSNRSIQRFTSEGQFVSAWGGGTWFGVSDLSTDPPGNLYVACPESDEVQKYDPNGKLICRWGSTGSGDGQFQYPRFIAVGPSGNVYVADTIDCRVQKFSSDGKFLAKWGTKGTEDGQFSGLFFMAVDGSGNVWVGDQLPNAKIRFQRQVPDEVDKGNNDTFRRCGARGCRFFWEQLLCV